MKVSEAIKIMEMDSIPIGELTADGVKRQYKKMALKLHPDKNGNTPESTMQFQDLSASYNIIMTMVSKSTGEPNTTHANDDTNIFTTFSATQSGYFDILLQFIKSTLDNMPAEYLTEKIKTILENCQDISVGLFENIDRDMSLVIFQFLSTYRQILHIQDDALEKIKTIIQQKFEELEIYTIEPTINDLLSDNVYKLKIGDELFLVPLWHKEMYFDMKNGKELLVLCQPILPDGWSIDENNHLYGSCEVEFTKSLLDSTTLPVKLDNGRHVINIHITNLAFVRQQTVCLKKRGILRINENNIYDCDERRDLVLTINFV